MNDADRVLAPAAPRLSTRTPYPPSGLSLQEQADWYLEQNPFAQVEGCPL